MYLTVKFHNFSQIPKGSVYLGDGDFDFQCKEYPQGIKERLAEFTDKKVKVYKKPRFNKKVKGEK